MPRRRVRWLAAVALAFVGVPAAAEAQLFPHLPIRRQRTPCAAEAPVFAQYRHEYFGYHPTCWRPFPTGWGCPSPEAPNITEVMRELNEQARQRPAEPTEQPEGMQAPEGETAPPTGPTPEGAMPELPRSRAPFPLDREAPGTTRPRSAAPPPADLGAPPVTPPANATPPRTEGSAPLPPPGATPPEASAVPARGRNLVLLDVGREPEAAPEATPAPVEAPEVATAPPPADPGQGQTYLPYSGAPAQPVLAPQRRGLLGGLFQRFNWTRR